MRFQAMTRSLVAAATLLAAGPAGPLAPAVHAQGTGSATMPSLYGFWNDNGWHVFVVDTPGAVTATYFTDVDCDYDDGSATVVPYDGNLDFTGTISGTSIDGQAQVCRFGSDQPNGAGLGMTTIHLDLTDPNTLSGYWIGDNGAQNSMSLVRLVDSSAPTPLPTSPPPTLTASRPSAGTPGANSTSQVGFGAGATPSATPLPVATPTPPASSGKTTPGGVLIVDACSVVTPDEIASALGLQVDQPIIAVHGGLTICTFPILTGSGSVIVSFTTNVPGASGMKDAGASASVGSGSAQITTATGSAGSTVVVVQAPAALPQVQALLDQILGLI